VDGADVLDRWHHVALIFDGNTLKLYVDLQLASETPVQGPLLNEWCPIVLGHTFPQGYLHGFMDEVCIYDTAMTADQMKELYAEQTADYQPPAKK
jgi:hypothetical protein